MAAIPDTRDLDLCNLIRHGAVSGLVFAQSLSWQQAIDSILVHFLGDAEGDEPARALWRAVLVTMLTGAAAWAVIVSTTRCTRRRDEPTPAESSSGSSARHARS